MSDEPDGPGYELMMPFVTVRSRGGVHEDHPYVMGYECGFLDARMKWESPPLIEQYHHTENVPQIDMLAMKNGYRIETTPWDEDPEEWVAVKLTKDTAS